MEKTSISLCPKCENWYIHPGDSNCSFCRKELRSFDVKPEVLRFSFKSFGNQTFKIGNTGANEVTVEMSIVSKTPENPDWISLKQKKYTVKPSSEAVVNLEYSRPNVNNMNEVFQATIQYSSKDGKRSQGEVRVIIEPPPRPEMVEMNPIQSGNVPRGLQQKINIGFVNKGGGILRLLEGVKQEPWYKVEVAEEEDNGFSSECRMNILLFTEKLGDIAVPNEEAKLPIPIFFEDVPDPIEVDVRLTLLQPPTFEPEAPGHINLNKILEGKTRKRQVKVKNSGGSPLVIDNLVINYSNTNETGWCRPVMTKYEIGENDSANIVFNINTTGLSIGPHNAVASASTVFGLQKLVSFSLEIVPLRENNEFIGIDFGTTGSCVAVVKDGESRLLSFSEDEKDYILPSAIVATGDGWKIGYEAEMYAGDPFLFRSMKRFLGSGYNWTIGGREFSARQLISEYLKCLLAKVEDLTNQKPTKVVLTVPASFWDRPIKEIKGICDELGLKESDRQILDEPTAAALYYISKNPAQLEREKSHILVYDFGGGTFDVSLLRVTRRNIREEFDLTLDDEPVVLDDVAPPFSIELLANAGDEDLGGEDLTRLIINNWIECISKNINTFDKNTFLLSKRELHFSRASDDKLGKIQKFRLDLYKESEEIKIALSKDDEQVRKRGVDELKDFVLDKGAKVEAVQFKLTRSEFEALILDKIDQTKQLIKECCDFAGIGLQDIDLILLIGRSSAIPFIKKQIAEFVSARIEESERPKGIVALGAAYYGYNFQNIIAFYKMNETATKLPHSYGFDLGQQKIVYVYKRARKYPDVHRANMKLLKGDEQEKIIRLYKQKLNRKEVKIGELQLDFKNKTNGGCELAFEVSEDRTLTIKVNGEVAVINPEKESFAFKDWI